MPEHKNPQKYDDIINMPHYQSKSHPHMSNHDRAAQFCPFAALTGYGAAIRETARLTDERWDPDEYMKAMLDSKLQIIADHLHSENEVTITFFKPDDKKSGGAYLTCTGFVKKIDVYEGTVIMADKTAIPIKQICDIESSLFRELDADIFDVTIPGYR